MVDDLFSVGSFAAKAIRRSLLRYTRRPIEYNFERLPAPEHYQNMELAFREDFFDPPPFSPMHFFSYVKYAALILLFLIGYFMFGIAIVTGLFAVLLYVWPELFSRQSAMALFRAHFQLSLAVTVAVLVVVAYLVVDVFNGSPVAVLLIGFPTLYLLKRTTLEFAYFSYSWLYTHPCLSNAERKGTVSNLLFTWDRFIPNSAIIILAANIYLGPAITLALLYMVLICGIVFGPLRAICSKGVELTWSGFGRAMARLVSEYFTYGRRFHQPLPGVYCYPKRHLERRRYAVMLLVLVLFTFAVGTNFFFPWNLPGFRGPYLAMFEQVVTESPETWAALEKELPHLDWSKLTQPAERKSMEQKLESMRDSRQTASLNDQILLDANIRQLSAQLSDTSPSIKTVGSAWYGRTPKSWIQMASRNILTDPMVSLASFAVALFNALLLPPLFLIAAVQDTLVSVALQYRKLEERVGREDTRSPWDWFVDRLRNSSHTAPDPLTPETVIRESDHLFLGLEAENGFPVLLHRDILAEHAYISGGSGSGKTSLGILSLLVQLIRSGVPDENNPEGEMPPIVIIDLKGEYALFHTVREEVRKQAEREGRTLEDSFRVFTSEKDMATHYFNPLGDMTYPDRYVADLANLLLDALELNHGPGYGRSYYSRKNYMLLHKVLQANDAATFDDLCNKMGQATKGNADERNQAFELMATLYGLTEFPQLKPPPDVDPSEMISMRQVIEKRQVVYFWLPTVESSIIAREIANLALFSYFSAMRQRAKSRQPIRQGYLVVDEFQKLAGDRFSVILQQARGFGLSTILSNQSISDLKTPSFDLRPTVLQNTRMKLFFSFTDCRDMNDFAKRSGDELAYARSGVYELAGDQQPDAPFFDKWSHVVKSKVTTNDMLRVTDHPLQAYLDIRSGSGYTQFGGATLPLQMFHPIRWSDFKRRRDVLPWPTLEDLGLRVATQSTVSPEEVDTLALAKLADLEARIREFENENPHLRFS